MKAKGKAWLEIIGYFSMFLLSFLVSATIFIFITYIKHGEFSANLELNINNIVIVSLLLCLLIYMFIIRKEKHISLWKYIGVRKLRLSDVLLVIGLGIIMSICIGFLTQLDIFQQLSSSHEEKISTEVQSDSILVVSLVIGMLVPFVEEIIFRGLVYQTLKAHYSVTATVMIQAAIFAVIHVNPLQIIYTFILGLLFIWLVMRLDSLWASILMHMSFNLTSIIILTIIQEKASVFLFVLLIIFAFSSFLFGVLMRLKKGKSRSISL